MKIGIVGAGAVGSAIGKLWAKAGHEVLFSSRHPETLGDQVSQAGAGAQAGTVAEAAEFGDLLLLSVNYWTLDQALQAVDTKLDGKILIDATNPLQWTEAGGTERVIPQEVTAGRVMAQRLPKARIVKALTTVYAGNLESEAHRLGEPVAIAIAGDDQNAKDTVAQLIREAGYQPVDIGSLDDSAPLDPGGVLWNKVLIEAELHERLQET